MAIPTLFQKLRSKSIQRRNVGLLSVAKNAVPTLAKVHAVPAIKVPPTLRRSLFPTTVRARTGPEMATTSAPARGLHRAIDRVNSTARMPDRSAAIAIHGLKITLPDGSSGPMPKTPMPIQSRLNPFFRKVLNTRANSQIRKTAIVGATRAAYISRVSRRPFFAQIVNTARYGALSKAQSRRIKPGTPTGVQGDRAAEMAWAPQATVYTQLTAPLSTSENLVSQKIAGSGSAPAPIALPANIVGAPAMNVEQAQNKTFAWAPTDQSGASPTVTDPGSRGLERFGVLIAVAVLGFFLIRRS